MDIIREHLSALGLTHIIPLATYDAVKAAGGQTALAHWVAAAHTIKVQGELIATYERAAVPQPTPEVEVKNEAAPLKDGAGGWLWKPVSESTGRPVVLGPNEFEGGKLQLYSYDGQTVDSSMVRAAVTGHNGNRMHWFFKRPTSYFKQFAPLLMVITANDRTVSWTIKDPSQRYD